MMTYGDYAAAISIIVIAVPGLFGNVNILAAILRKKDLRTKSGCLMCLVAFYDCISILFEIVTAKRLFCGEILPKRDCFASVVPYFIILVTQSYTLLALAVDRMIAIFYPMKYRQMSMTFSLLLSCLPGILIGSVLAVLAFVYMDDDTVAFCNPPMALPSKIEEIYRSYTVAVNICIISLYAISLYGIHRQKKLLHTIHDARHSRHVLQQQQTMRTIGVILMVFVAAYFVVQLVNFVIIYAQIDESLPAIEFIRGMSVVPIMITFSQSFYVYWWRSREYRTVFKEQLNSKITYKH
ncbi:hypothetical protein QR680_013934 [Steinernema hermaphroditum]|uniref:G-protein coupled receptors family 1 profile domain-containing protein n=1 Tax=Steinernema hermaphroditum TaxID=289476 RepID=A0AA39I8S1_9BILA|nr:hypothetical protein QR680_013934 [Steinernema hermaphroditum]